MVRLEEHGTKRSRCACAAISLAGHRGSLGRIGCVESIENLMGHDCSMINCTAIRDVWLKSCWPDPLFQYLRFWPEELYKLSVTCAKVEIPDVLTRRSIAGR